MIGIVYNADISPWAVGDLSPSWQVTLLDKIGNPLPLTGVTTGQLSLIIYNSAFVQIGTGAGTFALLPTPGGVQYNPALADSATAGTYYVRVRVNFNGANPQSSDYIQWVIQS